MRALVVYYSWTGNTAKAARAIADKLGADLEQIRERNPNRSRLRCALDSALRRKPAILETEHDPANYDVVIVGTPIWARAVAGPVRAWLAKTKPRLKSLAAFCTEGQAGGEIAMDVIAQLAGQKPLATLVLRQSELAGDSLGGLVSAFADTIQYRHATNQPRAAAG